MPLDDTAVLVPAVGHVFTNTNLAAARWTYTQLAAYASAGTIPATWLELGHTDLDNVLAFDQSGGDTEVKGSWQNPSLRQVVTSAVVDSFTIPAEQLLDNDVLKLYYGGGDASVTNEFAIPDVPTPQERQAIVVFLDGVTPLGFAYPKTSIVRADALSVDPNDFLKAPLKFTVLKASGLARQYIIADKVGA